MHKKIGISGSTLKIIAVLSMLLDHTATVLLKYFLVKNEIYSVKDISFSYIKELIQADAIGWVYLAYQVMHRVLGRLAFPIYCFLLTEGFEQTGNRKKYAGRLFFFALISEIPFNLAFSGKVLYSSCQNIFFTLFIGLLMIWGMEKVEKQWEAPMFKMIGWALAFLAAAALAEKLHCDYGAYAMAAIALLFLFRQYKAEQITAGCVAFVREAAAPLAFIFIALYNGKRGMKLKYFFYGFYPVHLLVLYLFTLIL